MLYIITPDLHATSRIHPLQPYSLLLPPPPLPPINSLTYYNKANSPAFSFHSLPTNNLTREEEGGNGHWTKEDMHWGQVTRIMDVVVRLL